MSLLLIASMIFALLTMVLTILVEYKFVNLKKEYATIQEKSLQKFAAKYIMVPLAGIEPAPPP